jgi:hypothetical protein
MSLIDQFVKNTYAYSVLRSFEVRRRWPKELADWRRGGMSGPPPHIVKQCVLAEYAQRFDLRILVETGTYYGDMVAAMRPHFDRVYSVELSENLHRLCVRRFKNDPHVKLYLGDSGIVLKKIVEELDRPTLFWLDGHYSAGNTAKGEKETPIFEELGAILKAKIRNHIIIVDDARCFGADSGYPTLAELTSFVNAMRDDLDISVEADSIRIVPKTVPAREQRAI